MENQVKPSIGRIVVFTPSGNDSECRHNGASEVPAIITRVFSDTVVNLKVITDGSATPWRTSATYSEEGTPYSWRWPQRV